MANALLSDIPREGCFTSEFLLQTQELFFTFFFEQTLPLVLNWLAGI